MFQIKFTNRARRELKNIKIIYQEDLDDALDIIREDPHIGKPLRDEYSGMFTFKLDVHRIVYTIDDKDQTITIITAGHRAVVYL